MIVRRSPVADGIGFLIALISLSVSILDRDRKFKLRNHFIYCDDDKWHNKLPVFTWVWELWRRVYIGVGFTISKTTIVEMCNSDQSNIPKLKCFTLRI
jgi:hypothetical protein